MDKIQDSREQTCGNNSVGINQRNYIQELVLGGRKREKGKGFHGAGCL
jgi:hypothetical protein